VLTASLIAGVATLVLLFLPIGIFVYLRRKRQIRIRGVRQTVQLSIYISLACSFAMMSIFDEPFTVCAGYFAWALLPMVFTIPTFFLFVIRFSRLYHRNILVANGTATLKDETQNVKSTVASEMREKLRAFSVKVLTIPKIRTLVWSIAFFLFFIEICLFMAYVTIIPGSRDEIPNSWSECSEDHVEWMLAFISILALETAFFGILLVGVVIDLRIQASQRGDSLGIKLMLIRMAYIALFTVILFTSLVFLTATGVIRFVSVVFGVVPLAMLLYIELLVVPIVRTLRAFHKHRAMMKKNGLLSEEELSRVYRNTQTKDATAAEAARKRTLFRLQAFALTADGYRTLRDHLAGEFGLETLHFVVEASSFANDFGHLAERPQATQRAQRGRKPEKKKSTLTQEERKSRRKTASPATILALIRQQTSRGGGGDLISLPNPEEMKKNTAEEMAISCVEIYRKFVSPGAPYQINVSSELLERFQGIESLAESLNIRDFNEERTTVLSAQASLPRKNRRSNRGTLASLIPKRGTKHAQGALVHFEPQPRIFNDLIREVLSMVYSDAFQRYLQNPANAQLWSKFISSQLEAEELSDDMRSSP